MTLLRLWKRRKALARFLAERLMMVGGLGICGILILEIICGWPFPRLAWDGIVTCARIFYISGAVFFLCGGKLHSFLW